MNYSKFQPDLCIIKSHFSIHVYLKPIPRHIFLGKRFIEYARFWIVLFILAIRLIKW